MRCKEVPRRSREDGRVVSAWLVSPTKAGLLLENLEALSSPGGGVGGLSQCWMVMRDRLGMALGEEGEESTLKTHFDSDMQASQVVRDEKCVVLSNTSFRLLVLLAVLEGEDGIFAVKEVSAFDRNAGRIANS